MINLIHNHIGINYLTVASEALALSEGHTNDIAQKNFARNLNSFLLSIRYQVSGKQTVGFYKFPKPERVRLSLLASVSLTALAKKISQEI